jgi:hypothetical protein
MGVCVLQSLGLDEASCVGRWTFAGRGRERGWDSNKGGFDKDKYPSPDDPGLSMHMQSNHYRC